MADSAQTKYYRTHIAGLSVVVGDPDTEKGEVAPQTVRFDAYEERYQGDKVKVGYLATDNLTAIKILAKDSNVSEIDKKEYEEATGKGSKRATV